MHGFLHRPKSEEHEESLHAACKRSKIPDFRSETSRHNQVEIAKAFLPSPGHELSDSYTNTGVQSKAATRLRHEENINVSPEWIYHYIFQDKQAGGDLYKYLSFQKQRKKCYGTTERRVQIKGRVSIDERPDVVNQRSRVGDWEADTVIGKQGGSVLVTLGRTQDTL